MSVEQEHDFWKRMEREREPELKLVFADWLIEHGTSASKNHDVQIALALRWCGRNGKHPECSGKGTHASWYDANVNWKTWQELKVIPTLGQMLPNTLFRLVQNREDRDSQVIHFTDHNSLRSAFLKLGSALSKLLEITRGAE